MIHYTPYLEEVIRDPYPIYKRLRDEAPAYFVEDYNCWFLSRFEDIWQCEIDTEGFTVSEGLMPGQLAASPAEQRAMAEMFEERAMGASIATVDPPQHTTLRSAVSAPFRPAAARVKKAHLECARRFGLHVETDAMHSGGTDVDHLAGDERIVLRDATLAATDRDVDGLAILARRLRCVAFEQLLALFGLRRLDREAFPSEQFGDLFE